MSRRNSRASWDDPSVILSGGPSTSRPAEDDDPPFVPPRLPLGFTAPIVTPRAFDLRVQKRIDDLVGRGLAREVADDLRRHGSDDMLDQLEAATETELLEVNAIHKHRAALCQLQVQPLLWDGDQA